MSRPAPVLEDGQVWAPGDAVGKALGVTLTPDGQVFRIKGVGKTAPRKVVGGHDMVSLRPLAEALGAPTRLDKNALAMFARVTDVRFTDGALRITTSFPVLHQTRRLTGPERIYVDLKGACIVGPQTESKSATSIVRALRLGQYDPDTARVTAETAGRAEFAVKAPARASHIVVALTQNQPPPPVKQTAAPATPPTKEAPAAAASEPVDIRQVRVENTRSTVRFTINGNSLPRPELRMEALANRLALALTNATVSAADRAWRFKDGPVQDASLVASGPRPGEVLLKVSGLRPLASRVLAGTSPNEVVWEVFVPEEAEGDWRAKIVVIDPGHGGKDRGASANGLMEKDLNLAVALTIKQEAERRGLSRVLTRTTDTYLTLKQRVDAIAANNASVFVSIHANSNGRVNSVSGMEVYYHKQDPSSRMLAQLVHDEIAAATGIAARGARSDLKLYNTGLYVLRNSTVPAILVEMGYVNHGSDAKLLSDTGFQGQTARAIVDAVIRYLGGPASLKAEGPG